MKIGFSIKKSDAASKKNSKISIQYEQEKQDNYEIIKSVHDGIIDIERLNETDKNLSIECKHLLPIPQRRKLQKNCSAINNFDLNALDETTKKAAQELRAEAGCERTADSVVPILMKNSQLADLRKDITSDAELYKKEIAMLPEVDSGSYNRVSVNDFGLALLRGMGYDPEVHTTKAHTIARRGYERAGLGAVVDLPGMGPPILKKDLISSSASAPPAVVHDPSRVVKSEESVVDIKTSLNSFHNIAYGLQTAPKTKHQEMVKKEDIKVALPGEKKQLLIANNRISWMEPGLIVKITDPEHSAYKKKGVIQDVDDPNRSCQLTLLPRYGEVGT
eukprot:GHVL01024127.1.p1 GENE.GHVL01024127.1~~GHVL01024127.1.p1  ORF type:complete len:333 (-),score=46.86 GHVL01024127.1:979-1977(-)